MANDYKIVYHLTADDRQLRSTVSKMHGFLKTQAPTMRVNVDHSSARNLSNMERSLDRTGKAATQTANKLKTLGESTALAASRFAAFSIAATPMYILSKSIANSLREAVAFDKQMVRIGQTLGTSHRNLTSLNKQITDLSVNWGNSSAKLVDVSRVLAQTGMSARDVQKSLEALSKTELTPSFNDLGKTTEGLIAIMNQFSISASEVEDVLDDINIIAKRFPVESEDIIAAVRKAGGVFKTTGGNVREFIALFTAVRSTTRETAETIGTGFRTIFARLERTRTRNILANLGIDIRNVESGYEAIRIVANEVQRLQKLGPAGQSALAVIREELGGIRQIAKVVPLLAEFGKAERAYAIMEKEGGSLDRDRKQAQEALEIQLNKTKEAFLSLGRAIVDDPSIRFFAGSILQLTTNIAKMAEALKSVIPIIALIGAIKFTPKFYRFGTDFAGELGKKLHGGIPRSPLSLGGSVGEGRIPTILTPREGVVHPRMADMVGRDKLERLNHGIVPGVGNKDTIPVDLLAGSFVLNTRAMSRLGMNKGGSVGGRIGFARGGRVKVISGKNLADEYYRLEKIRAEAEKQAQIDLAYNEDQAQLEKKRLQKSKAEQSQMENLAKRKEKVRRLSGGLTQEQIEQQRVRPVPDRLGGILKPITGQNISIPRATVTAAGPEALRGARQSDYINRNIKMPLSTPSVIPLHGKVFNRPFRPGGSPQQAVSDYGQALSPGGAPSTIMLPDTRKQQELAKLRAGGVNQAREAGLSQMMVEAEMKTQRRAAQVGSLYNIEGIINKRKIDRANAGINILSNTGGGPLNEPIPTISKKEQDFVNKAVQQAGKRGLDINKAKLQAEEYILKQRQDFLKKQENLDKELLAKQRQMVETNAKVAAGDIKNRRTQEIGYERRKEYEKRRRQGFTPAEMLRMRAEQTIPGGMRDIRSNQLRQQGFSDSQIDVMTRENIAPGASSPRKQSWWNKLWYGGPRGGGGGGNPPGGGGGGGGGNPPGGPPKWFGGIGKSVRGMARNPMTWMVAGSLLPQAAEGFMSEDFKKSAQGQGISAGIGAGITTAATAAMINPLLGAFLGLVVGIKAYSDAMKRAQEELDRKNFDKSLDNLTKLMNEEGKLRKENNEKFEKDLKKAKSEYSKQTNIQIGQFIGTDNKKASEAAFNFISGQASRADIAKREALSGRSVDESGIVALASQSMGEGRIESLRQLARQNAEALTPRKVEYIGTEMGQQKVEVRDYEAERKKASELFRQYLLTLGGPELKELQETGDKNRQMMKDFSQAQQEVNLFISKLNDIGNALAYARESASDFDNQLAMLSGGSIKASTKNLRVLQNPKMASDEEYRNVVSQTGGGIIGGVALSKIDLAKQLQDILPGLIEAKGSDVEGIIGAARSTILGKGISGERAIDLDNILTLVQNQLQGELESGKAIINTAEATKVAKDSLDNILGATGDALIKIEQERIAIEQKIIDDLTSVYQQRKQVTQKTLEVGAFGYSIDKARIQREFEQGRTGNPNVDRATALRQFGAQQNAILTGTGLAGKGQGVTPAIIGAEITRLKEENKNIIDSIKLVENQDKEENKNTIDPTKLVKNQDKMDRLNQALDNLAQSNEMLEQAQSKLASAIEKQNQARSVAERYITGSRSERRGIEKSMQYAEQLRQQYNTTGHIGLGDIDRIPKKYRRDTYGMLGDLSSLGRDTTYGMTGGAIADDVIRRKFPVLGNVGGEVRIAESGVRQVEDTQKAAYEEQLKLQNEKFIEYSATISNMHNSIQNVAIETFKKIEEATLAIQNTKIQHEIKPVNVIVTGDTAIQALGPLMEDLIAKAIADTLKTGRPQDPPTINGN